MRQAFIESSVVKLDYGKVSTTDLSSFDIPLVHGAADDLRYRPVGLSKSTRSSSYEEYSLKLYLAL